jgi:cell filamentation protein
MTAFIDPYCLPGTKVLRNVQGFTDKNQLERFESLSASLAADDLYKHFPHSTDLTYLKAIHRTLFGAVYPWAGETRRDLDHMTKTRENGSVVTYGNSAYVEAELSRIFALLAAENYLKGLPIDRFAIRAAYFYGELDAIHAFREGNSRTLRVFFAAVAYNAGFKADWASYSITESARDNLYRARDRAVMHGDSAPLAAIFSSILAPL